MSFDYERDTRTFYQRDAVARQYHDLFMSRKGWRSIPFRVVARHEQRAIAALLKEIPHHAVLDIPAGTGKLADIFAALGSRVMACDISRNMLRVAEAEYARIGYDDVSFRVEDASDLGDFGRDKFDAVICLRLMHRVPPALREIMLQEFARVAPYAIVSFGIENAFHRTRRSLKSLVFDGRNDALCFCSMAQACAELRPLFDIMEKVWIAPTLSQEVVFLLKSKRPHVDAEAA